MESISYKVKNNVKLESKPRVYFTCHPRDFKVVFDKICDDIFKTQDCIIYYTEDMTYRMPDKKKATDLERMNLFVIPVSYSLLSTSNRAMDVDLKYAKEKKIPILPIMIEPGLDNIYRQENKFGNIQYLDAYDNDATAISYEEKLENYLESVLINEETTKKIRAAFDSYIFLSYRKVDRAYANELMRMIHKNPLCRDIAIWYDEFLTPGREYDKDIKEALHNCNLFMLLVTKNLLEKGNYVQRIEYPEAKKAGKKIMAVDMDRVGNLQLKLKFALDAPKCIDGKDEYLFQSEFLKIVKNLGLTKEQNGPNHNYYIGLAYLNGLDVEIDREKAIELIKDSANANLPEAMLKLYEMYKNADGVERNYKESLRWIKKLADYYIKKYGEESLRSLNILKSLATAYNEAGEYRNALEIHERIYPLYCKVCGKEDKRTLGVLVNMAVTYWHLGDYKKALEIEEKLYPLYCKIYGQEHPNTLTLRNNMAVSYSDNSNYQKALEIGEELYPISCRVLGEEHPSTLFVLNSLALTYGNLGHYQKALELHKKVYQLRCKVLGEEHPDTLTSLGSLAEAYGKLGQYQKELELHEKVYQLRCKILGEEHPDTLITLSNMASSYDDLGNDQKALELNEKVYQIRCKILGEEHPKTLITLNNIVGIYGDLGNYQKKLEIAEKLYTLCCKVLGKEHVQTNIALDQMADAYWYLGNYQKSLELYEEIYRLRCSVLGEKHPHTLIALSNLGGTYFRLRNYQKAMEIGEKVYQLRCEVLGPKHRDTIKALNNLDYLRKKLNQA